jgi:hypothetical protein
MPRPLVDLNVFGDEIERQDGPLPPVIPAIVRRYKSSVLISALTSAVKSSITDIRWTLTISDTDTGKNAGENESEAKGNEGLQDIREIFNKVKESTVYYHDEEELDRSPMHFDGDGFRSCFLNF